MELPENSLKQYYRWVKEQEKDETVETLNEWVAEEADFQMQASEVKHGFTSRSRDRKHEDSRWSRRDGKSSKSFGTSLQEGNKKHLTTKMKMAREKENYAGHAGSCIIVFPGWPRDRKWDAVKQFGLSMSKWKPSR